MTRRSGLGKGLSSLIPPGRAARAVGDGDRPTLVEIAVADIIPNPNQPRVHFDEETLGRAGRVDRPDRRAAAGARAPRRTSGYQLIAGERRWRAARRAGLTTVPAVVRTTDDVSAVEQALVENLHRAGSHPARGGRGVPAADRGLRAHPRGRRQAGRQEPLGGHQHAAPARPAAGGAAPARRRQAVGGPRPRAARHAGPRAAGAAGAPGRRRGLVGAHDGGVAFATAACAPARTAPTPRARADAARRLDGAGLDRSDPAASARPARAGAAARRPPRHPSRRADGRQARQGDDRVRRPRGPRADLPAHRRASADTPSRWCVRHRTLKSSTPVHVDTSPATVTHSEWTSLWTTPMLHLVSGCVETHAAIDGRQRPVSRLSMPVQRAATVVARDGRGSSTRRCAQRRARRPRRR